MKSKRKRGGNIKREKILDIAQKMRLKRKTRKISARRKKHSDMIISNRFENPIFAIRKWLLPRGSTNVLAPLLFLGVRLAAGLHKLWYPVVRDMSTLSKFGAHGEHGDVFLFSNSGAL